MVSQNTYCKNRTMVLLSLCLYTLMAVMVDGSQGYAQYILITTEKGIAQQRRMKGREMTQLRARETVDVSRRKNRSKNDGETSLASRAVPSQTSLWGTSVSTAFRQDPTRNMIENLIEVSSVVETESLETLERH